MLLLSIGAHHINFQEKKRVHIDVNGPPGAGKDTVLGKLAERHPTIRIPRITSRRRREGEVEGWDYYFVSPPIFRQRALNGDILPQSIVATIEGGMRFTGILDPHLWPGATEDEIKISMLGRAGLIFQFHVPDMQLFYVTLHDKKELERRLRARCKSQKVNFKRKWEKAQWYMEEHLEKSYPHVIYNDGPVEEAVAEIEKITGLCK